MPNSRKKHTGLSLRFIAKIIDECFIGRSPFRAAHVMTIDLRLDALTDASNQQQGGYSRRQMDEGQKQQAPPLSKMADQGIRSARFPH
jgi:hypothetical protein